METAEDGIGKIGFVWDIPFEAYVTSTELEFSECSGLQMKSWDLVVDIRGVRRFL